LPTETAGSPCATTIAGDALVIPSAGKNHDAAWKWIEFLSAPQNMALLNLGTKKNPTTLLPPRTSLLNNPATFKSNPILKPFAVNMKCGITTLSQNPNWGQVDSGPLSDALAHGIYGKGDVTTLLQSAAQQANQLLQKPS
jgi:multiple sugar transport system substrate-binding protein